MYDCSGWQIDQSSFNELMGNVPTKKFKIKFNPFKKKGGKDGDGEKNQAREEDSASSANVLSEGGVELEMGGMDGGGDMKQFFGDSAVKDSDNENHKKQVLEKEEVGIRHEREGYMLSRDIQTYIHFCFHACAKLDIIWLWYALCVINCNVLFLSVVCLQSTSWLFE